MSVEYFLNTPSSPHGLRATLNPYCSEPHSNLFVQGLLGVRKFQATECVYIQSSTQSFKESDTVFIELDLVLESTTYEYCAAAILNGRERTIVDGELLSRLLHKVRASLINDFTLSLFRYKYIGFEWQ